MGLPKLVEPLPATERRVAGYSFNSARPPRGEPSQPVVRSASLDSPLSALEQTVVALSLHDDARSFAPPHGLRLFIFRLFGGALPNRLADPKLEALRRFAVMSRERSGDTDDERRRFHQAGYTTGSVTEVGRLLDRAKT